MGELGFDLFSILWQGVAFGILVYVLHRFMYRPTLAMLDRRAEAVSEARANTEQARIAAESAQDNYNRSVEEARRRGQEIVAEATKGADVVRAELEERARQDAQRIVAEARVQAEAERQQAMAAMRQDIVDLSLEATRRVLGTGLDAGTHRQLVDQFIAGEQERAAGGQQ